MRDSVEKFLSRKEREAVEERIRAAEARTAGEIVVMVVPSSYHYPLANVLGGALFGLVFAIILSLASGWETMWHFLGFFLVSFALGNEAIKRSFFLKRFFVTASDMEEEVKEAAVGSFYKKEIYDTVDHTGILIYVSLFEHRVWVLADKGINARVDAALWKEIAALVVEGVRQKRAADALAEAVDRCGDILAEHFPRKPDDRNELDDRLIVGQ